MALTTKFGGGAFRKTPIKKIGGKEFTLYKSGTKKVVDDYIKQYGIPKNANYRILKQGDEYGLYMKFNK